jgi:hypothetical protein
MKRHWLMAMRIRAMTILSPPHSLSPSLSPLSHAHIVYLFMSLVCMAARSCARTPAGAGVRVGGCVYMCVFVCVCVCVCACVLMFYAAPPPSVPSLLSLHSPIPLRHPPAIQSVIRTPRAPLPTCLLNTRFCVGCPKTNGHSLHNMLCAPCLPGHKHGL